MAWTRGKRLYNFVVACVVGVRLGRDFTNYSGTSKYLPGRTVDEQDEMTLQWESSTGNETGRILK